MMQGSRCEIAEVIRGQLEADNDRTRWCAVKALGRLDAREALPGLMAALCHDPDPDVRMEAAAVLGAWSEPQAVDGLIDAINGDPDDDVRLQACRALGQIREPRAEQTLIDCLGADDAVGLVDWDTGDDIGFNVVWELQREALEGLARIGGEKAIEAAIRLLSEDDEDDLQGLGTRVLATIGGQRAAGFVVKQLEEGHRTARRQAAKALGYAQAPDETVIPPLLAALADAEPDVRIAAGWSLMSKAEAATYPALIKLLQDPDASVRGEAVRMVSGLSAPEVITPLIRLAYDLEPTVQQRAIQTLAERREPRAAAHLLALLTRSQENDVLANTLIKALGRINAFEVLEPLGKFLQSGRLPPTARMQAVLALGGIAAEAPAAEPAEAGPIDILIGLIDDEDLRIGQAALLALSWAGGERAHAALINTFRGSIAEPACDAGDERPAPTFPTSTLEALQVAGAAGIKPEPAGAARWRLRACAARIIRDLDLPDTQVLFYHAARDKDPEFRCEAMLGLGRRGGDDDVMALLAGGLNDASREVRLAALQALAQMPPDDAVHLLLERLAIESDPLVKQRLLESAGRLGGRRALGELNNALDDEDRHVQCTALEALACLADSAAISAVRPLLFAHGGALWREALTTLQRLRDPEIVSRLVDTLRRPEQEDYHWIAVEALAVMGLTEGSVPLSPL